MNASFWSIWWQALWNWSGSEYKFMVNESCSVLQGSHLIVCGELWSSKLWFATVIFIRCNRPSRNSSGKGIKKLWFQFQQLIARCDIDWQGTSPKFSPHWGCLHKLRLPGNLCFAATRKEILVPIRQTIRDSSLEAELVKPGVLLSIISPLKTDSLCWPGCATIFVVMSRHLQAGN